MQKDGLFSVTGAWDGLHKSYMFTYQATPWLEGTFRYTGFNDFFHWDRNYEVKARLWEEQYLLPQVSVGIRDLVGTGVFGSEYLVASKSVGNFDLTLGMGWGRLAGDQLADNPLGYVADRFKQRTQDEGLDATGKFSLGTFFSGPAVGLFGGLSYRSDQWPVTLLLEYNPDDYEFNNRGDREYLPSSKVSYGITWEPVPGLEITASHQHQDVLAVAFTARIDTKSRAPRKASREFISSRDLPQSALPPQINKASWYDSLLYDAERSGLILVSGRISEDQRSAQLVVGNAAYAMWGDAIARHIALADLHLPPLVETLYFIVEDGGHRVGTVVIARPSSMSSEGSNSYKSSYRVLPARAELDQPFRTDFTTGKVNFTVNVNNRLQLFDPDDPARYQLYLDVGAEYALTSHWAVKAKYGLNLTNNFDESARQESDSLLPKVRSDIVKYLTEGETGIDMLMIDGRDTLRDNLHFRVFGGILEEMYSGIGAEILLTPFQSRLAYGLSLAQAHQRDFDKSFRHLDYKVLTGFGSVYWATPFYDFDAAAHVGRFLARDWGASFELRRTFDNGWQIGVWATFTDVPFDEFGEGSFDKGFFFKIPLDGLSLGNTRSAYSTRMRPVQRDGGQRLENHSATLYWDLRAARYDALIRAEDRL
jgi:hypothetical protein